MARRGDILRATRRLGFAARGQDETFLVLQSDALNDILPTVVVAPLHGSDDYASNALAVPVTRADGSTLYVLVWLLAAVPLERFQADRAGHLPPIPMRAVDRAVRRVLELP